MYNCQACFYADFTQTSGVALHNSDISNPVVFCDTCNFGVHKKCQGLVDIDIDFKCEECSYLLTKYRTQVERKMRKLQQAKSAPRDQAAQRSKSVILEGSSKTVAEVEHQTTRQVLESLPEVKCIFCLRSGGALKHCDSTDIIHPLLGDKNTLRVKAMNKGKNNVRRFYHIFCANVLGKFFKVRTMKKFKLHKKYLDQLDSRMRVETHGKTFC